MKNLLLLLAFAAVAPSTFAQQPNAQSVRDHAYRLVISTPTYSLSQAKAVIKKIKADGENNQGLTEKKFNALPFNEKFTYTMIHGEDFMQNCNAMPAIAGEGQKIFAFLPEPFADDMGWSEQQRNFLTNHRSTVIPMIRTTIVSSKRCGINLKQAIVLLNAYEVIPDMVKVFNSGGKRDNDILTAFMLLMKEAKYKPFMESASYKKLYADESESYKAFLVANSENKQLECDRAMAFYKSKKG